MSRKLPNLVDNLSEIYKKECKGCKERKRSKQYVILSGLKVINYVANANNVKKRLKPINWLIKKFSNIHQFCNGDINKFVLLSRKVCVLINSWIAGKDLMKHHYQR